MKDLAWLVDHRFQSIARREYDWIFVFDKNVSLAVSCLWRLVEGGRITLTSQDEGQQFGLPRLSMQLKKSLAGLRLHQS